MRLQRYFRVFGLVLLKFVLIKLHICPFVKNFFPPMEESGCADSCLMIEWGKKKKERLMGMDHGEKAAELFLRGYNCAQSLAVAFSDVTGLDEAVSAKMASSFGGGMGRLREVCGAVSGMFLVLGLLYGYDTPGDNAGKKRLYAEVQELAAQFRQQTGSILCREILKNPPSDPNPSPRTAEYYKTRPCARMVLVAAQLMDGFIASHPLTD